MVLGDRAELEAPLRGRGLRLREAVLPVAERAPEVAHRLRVREQRVGERLLLGLREPGDVEELAERPLADEVGLAQYVVRPLRLQALDLVTDPSAGALRDQIGLHRALERPGLDLRRKGEDQRPDPVDERVDEREGLCCLEQRARQCRRHALAQECVEDRGGDLMLRFEPRR